MYAGRMGTTSGATTTSRIILECLIKDNDAQKAVALTVGRDANKAYSLFKYVRQRIFRDDSHRNAQYLQRVRHFQHVHFSPQDDNWWLLDSLLHASLREQYRVETGHKPYLAAAPDLDKALRQIRCLPDVVYDYVMPPEVVQRAKRMGEEARERKHLKALNVGDLQTLISKAREWPRYEHAWEWVACALLLSGRRTCEILECMEWERDGPYTARVTGLGKDNEDAVIPLLVTYEEFDALMYRIREARLPIDGSTHRLKPAMKRVFGKWYDHGQRRNIYAEAAFHERNASGFYPEMSKIMWIEKALSHSLQWIKHAGNLTYQSLTFQHG